MRYWFYLCFFIFLSARSVFAFWAVSSDANIFTTSYTATEQNNLTYGKEAISDFTKKLNIAIKNHKQLKELSESCGWCDVVLPWFDEYLKNNYPNKHYGLSLVQQGLIDPSVPTLDNETIKILDQFIYDILSDIQSQVDYLANKQTHLDSMNRYADGDLTNSSYDIMDKMKKILGLFINDPFEYEWYVNTMNDDARGLITGRFETGQWAQGETYEIDLASDIASALGEGDSDDGEGDSDAEDCEDGFCITLDIITNDQYLLNSRNTSFVDKNFEEILKSWINWLVDKGDKRNLACKWPPPVNQFQSNNDQNLSFKNIFRWLGIFVFQKTPKYAKNDGWPEEEKSEERKQKQTDDLIKKNLKRYNIDTDNLMQYTDKQMIEQATPISRYSWPAIWSQRSALQNRKDYLQDSTVQSDMKERGNTDKGLKNLFRSFDSMMQSFSNTSKDLFDIVDVWKNKPTCKN